MVLESLMNSTIWNSKAKFLIQINSSRKNWNLLALFIIRTFWKHFVIDVTIIAAMDGDQSMVRCLWSQLRPFLGILCIVYNLLHRISTDFDMDAI